MSSSESVVGGTIRLASSERLLHNVSDLDGEKRVITYVTNRRVGSFGQHLSQVRPAFEDAKISTIKSYYRHVLEQLLNTYVAVRMLEGQAQIASATNKVGSQAWGEQLVLVSAVIVTALGAAAVPFTFGWSFPICAASASFAVSTEFVKVRGLKGLSEFFKNFKHESVKELLIKLGGSDEVRAFDLADSIAKQLALNLAEIIKPGSEAEIEKNISCRLNVKRKKCKYDLPGKVKLLAEKDVKASLKPFQDDGFSAEQYSAFEIGVAVVSKLMENKEYKDYRGFELEQDAVPMEQLLQESDGASPIHRLIMLEQQVASLSKGLATLEDEINSLRIDQQPTPVTPRECTHAPFLLVFCQVGWIFFKLLDSHLRVPEAYPEVLPVRDRP